MRYPVVLSLVLLVTRIAPAPVQAEGAMPRVERPDNRPSRMDDDGPSAARIAI